MTATPSGVTWSTRRPALAASAVIGQGRVADALAAATARGLSEGADLKVIRGDSWFAALGGAAQLPWADGCVYLGWDGGVLLPTTLVPMPPAAVLAAVFPSAPLRIILNGHVFNSRLPSTRPDLAQLIGEQR